MEEKRFFELSNRAERQPSPVFTDFLDLDAQSTLQGTRLPCTLWGGYAGAERVVAAFGREVEPQAFPIACLRLAPASPKFAQTLTHRDFLGALLHLGLKRSLLGDLLVRENSAYLFCLAHIAPFLTEELTQVKHTAVRVQTVDELPQDALPQAQAVELVVSSCRLDVLVSAVYRLSRKEALRLFQSDKVFVNSRRVQSASQMAQEKDIVSVRGHGRFTFTGVVRRTKKDRLVVALTLP